MSKPPRPTITFGHEHLTDCDDTTGWVETEDGNTATLSVVDGDVFKINVSASAGNKVVYYSYPDEGGAENLGISSSVDKRIVFRYKTSDDSIKAKIVLVFSSGTQTVLDETSSSLWKHGSVEITDDKTVDHIRVYATQATGDVYYDFVLICRNIYTFPHIAPGGIKLEVPTKTVEIDIPRREGGVLQRLGMKSPIITLTGDMQHGEGWGLPFGERMLQIMRDSDPWQWFTSDRFNCKVTPADNALVLDQRSDANGALTVWQMRFKLYSLSSLGSWLWGGRQWYGEPI